MNQDGGQLPGADLIKEGLEDLAQNRKSDCAYLVLIASPRLKRLGISIPIPDWPRPFEHELYARLGQRLGNGAHSHYNSLLRRMDSLAHALEREQSRGSAPAFSVGDPD
jgi:hypothetical protein